MTIAETAPIQKGLLAATAAVIVALGLYLFGESTKQGVLLLIGLGLGVALYHAAFGFTGAYRKAMVEGDLSGVAAQFIMLIAAMGLFAPVLAQGTALGHGVGGALAPVSTSMAIGAFIFGIGMQLGGGCASGTLFTAGGGSPRMVLVLVFFCIGAFWGSLDLYAWEAALPSAGVISLAKEWGWEIAVPAQLLALGLIYWLLRSAGASPKAELWWGEAGFSWRRLLRGPWPLLLSALMLAALNFAVLLTAGHPWTVTWAFSLWAAKGAVLLGWDPATSAFWSNAFQARALSGSLLSDNVSILNFGILLGAFGAAALAGKVRPVFNIPLASLIAAVVGGLMMGYGARLAYGCNIGAFFSGIASTSLHGWVWIAAALIGNVIGIKLRPYFGLDGFRRQQTVTTP